MTATQFTYSHDPKVVCINGFNQDITERKISEMEHDGILADLFKRNKALEQFSYIVSHNLRAQMPKLISCSKKITRYYGLIMVQIFMRPGPGVTWMIR